jgi:hypothetical protein
MRKHNHSESDRLSASRTWKDAIKSELRRILRLRLGAEHVTCMEKIINAYRIFKGVTEKISPEI